MPINTHHRGGKSVKRYLVLWSIVVLVAAGCASTYRPPLDPTFATDRAKLDRDLYQCEQIARSHAPDPGSKAVESGAVGAVGWAAGGAAIGAIGGAIGGSAGTGAAIGAATGATVGAAGGGLSRPNPPPSQF